MTEKTDLILNLFRAYQQGDYAAMTECYHPQATFQDIAFRLHDRQEIAAMLQLICTNGIEIVIDDPPNQVDDQVVAGFTATYVFSSTGRQVVNVIRCVFRFQDGLIIEQRDFCDPVEWGRQAFGGFTGWVAGHIAFVRRRAARKKIDEMLAQLQAA